MKVFARSLALRIGIIIIIIEVVVMTLVGVIYYSRFSNAVDRRLTDRMQTAGELLGGSELNISSVVNPDVMEVLIGEEIIDSMLIRTQPERIYVQFSLNPAYRNETIDVFTDVDETWFSDNSTGRIERVEFDGQTVLTGVFPVETDSTLHFLFRSDVSQADEEKQQLIAVFVGGSLATVLATSLAIFVVFNTSILARLRELVTTAERVEAGELSVRILSADSSDEIGILQRSVNSMTARLQSLFETLEQRVAARTRELEIAADVSKQITTVLDIDVLLDQVATLTCRGFDLYASTIFLLDEDQQKLNSAAGITINHQGETTPVSRWSIELDAKPSIVAKAARDRAAVLVNDVASNELHLKNPTFLETQAEIAVPIIIGDHLIGIFDLQSQQANRFGPDDVRVLTSLAEQIAIAIQNARMFTESQLAREAAEKSDQVKSAFLASMSHELRTPLNSIINFTKFVQEGDLGDVNEGQKNALGQVIGSGKHLLSLINDVLDMSKVEAGALTLFVEDDVNLNKVIDVVYQTGRSLLGNKPVKLQSEVDELPLIRGDRQRIAQILLNIVSNACKFTDAGQITLQASVINEEVIIAIEDTGPGISIEDQELVFQAFQQTSTGLRQSGGTGLGMPLSRSLAEAHGGRLWVESELGKGSIFYVALPIKSEKLVPVKLKEA